MDTISLEQRQVRIHKIPGDLGRIVVLIPEDLDHAVRHRAMIWDAPIYRVFSAMLKKGLEMNVDCPDCGRKGELLRLEAAHYPGKHYWHCVSCKTDYMDSVDANGKAVPGKHVGVLVNGCLFDRRSS